MLRYLSIILFVQTSKLRKIQYLKVYIFQKRNFNFPWKRKLTKSSWISLVQQELPIFGNPLSFETDFIPPPLSEIWKVTSFINGVETMHIPNLNYCKWHCFREHFISLDEFKDTEISQYFHMQNASYHFFFFSKALFKFLSYQK